MTLDEFERTFVKGLRYKPTWWFEWEKYCNHYSCTVTVYTQDADPKKERRLLNKRICKATTLQNRWIYTFNEIKGKTIEQLTHDIYQAIIAMEEHEAMEWFYIGDVHPFDPHKIVERADL